MNNIGVEGELILDLVRTVPAELAPKDRILERGDVLVCTTNSGKLVGKCAHFDLTGQFAYSNHLTRLRPTGAVDGSFLRWALWMAWKEGRFEDSCKHWVNQSTLPKDALMSLDIALPALAEQRRIVTKLDLVLGRVRASRQRLEKVPRILARFRQSVLAAGCSGRLGNTEHDEVPANWVRNRLDSLFAVHTGGTPSRKESRFFLNGSIPWVKTGEVQNGDICEAAERITPVAVEESSARIFPAGTLLVAMYGEGKTRGQVGWLRIPAATNQACAALINESMSDETRQYVFYFLLSQYHTLRAESVGGNQPNLNLGIIKGWEIALPPRDEQIKIVKAVRRLLAFADAIDVRVEAARKRIAATTQAVLAKAFRGDLI